MKHIFKFFLLLITVISCGIQKSFAQTNWNNIFYAPSAPNTGYIYNVKKSIAVDGYLYIYGDTLGSFMQSPYVVKMDPVTHAVTPLSLSTYSTDSKMRAAAAITNTTSGVSTIFFGAEVPGAQYPGLYKYNTQTGITTSEQITDGMANYHQGIHNLAFFTNAGASSHDTLNIFANYFGNINVYRKHYNQTGFSSAITTPFQSIYESIVYRDTLYVFGYSNVVNSPRLYKTADGRNYAECIGFSNLQSTLTGASYGFDLDTLNNSLYLLLGDNEGFTRIVKTDDGSSFYEPQTSGYFKRYVDLKGFKNKMWVCGKSMSFSANYNDLTVAYLDNAGLDVLSVDTLGYLTHNSGNYYHLNVIADSLYSPGSFDYYESPDAFSGVSIFKLSEPKADVSYLNNIACRFSSLTFTSTSTKCDSLHWLVDGAYIASSPGASAWYNINFPTTGNHVVGLVAFGAGLTDTINVVINVYEIQASVLGSAQNCEGVPLDVVVSETGAYAPINYQWYQSNVASGTDSVAFFTNPGPGSYTYRCILTDVHGCMGYSDTLSVTIGSSKNILGLVTTNTLTPVPVAGSAVLYRYEPFLIKFDSVTVQTLDAAGGYTFTSVTADDYIVKIIPTDNSLQITYGTSFTTWQDATVLTHGCLADKKQDINVQALFSLPGLGTGAGVLTGTVIIGNGFERPGGSSFKPTAPGNPIGGIVVKGGRNPGGQMFIQTLTDGNGTYTLSGLPENNGGTTGNDYFIQVDIPGLDTNGTYHRTITSTNNIFEHLDFVLDSIYVNPINNTVGIHDINAVEHQLAVYPNPTTDRVNINFDLKSNSDVKIDLFDITGRTVKTLLPQTTLSADKHKQSYQLDNIPSGLYFIKLSINGKESTIKLCITN